LSWKVQILALWLLNKVCRLLCSLRGGSSIPGHEVIIFLFPGWHVLRHASCERRLSLLNKRLFFLETFLDRINLSVVLGVHLEHFRVVSHLLFIRNPSFLMTIFLMRRVFQVKIDSSHIVMIDSMFDILEIIMSHRHTNLSQFIQELILWVLALISEQWITVVYLLAEGLLGLMLVHWGKLLHLQVVLANEMFLLLC